MKTGRFFYVGKFVLFGIAGLILFTFVVMWLWNWLVPELFNGPVLTWWHTIGLLILSKILFSGIGRGPHSRTPRDRHFREHDWPWKDREKWRMKFEAKMNGKVETPEGE